MFQGPTAVYLSGLLDAERRRSRTHRSLGSWRHAVLVLRRFLDTTRIAQLAADNQISSPTAYRYLHEGIDALTAVAPGPLLAARSAGHSHLGLDGT